MFFNINRLEGDVPSKRLGGSGGNDPHDGGSADERGPRPFKSPRPPRLKPRPI